MPKRRPKPPPTGVERDLIEALERLKDGKPKHPDLAKQAAMGRLKITFSSVAREAGRARTLIALDNCRYPHIRALIQDAVTPVPGARTAEDVIRGLRQENAELRRQVKLNDSVNLAYVRRLRQVEKAARREIGAAERRARRSGRDPHAIAGAGFDASMGTVVPFHQDRPDDAG